MNIYGSVGEFFALDIGTTAIRVVQLARNGKSDVWTLLHYGYAPVDAKIANSDSESDQRKLCEVILTVLGQSGIKTRDVVIGIPSNKTFATVVDLPKMSPQELKTNIKYEAEQFIPMSIDEVKIDYAYLGDSPTSPDKAEVLITSVANAFNESRLDMLEDIGLNVISMEPDSIAMLRSSLPENATGGALFFEMGDNSSDVVVIKDGAPRLVRAIPIGFQSLAKAAAQNLNIEHSQAQQLIFKFGLAPDRLEGQIVKALEGTVDQFISEIQKSISFFQNRYSATPVASIYMSGFASVIPMFGDKLNQQLNTSVVLSDPWHKVQAQQSDKAKLASIASQFTVALGLAQRRGF